MKDKPITIQPPGKKHNKTITITLTYQPPVKILKEEWPVIARGRYKGHEYVDDRKASRIWNINILVRKNADGRAIVYGKYEYNIAHINDKSFIAHSGVLLEKYADLVIAIKTVGNTLAESAMDEQGYFRQYQEVPLTQVVRDCIAQLQAQEI